MMDKVTILITTFNRVDLLKKCLEGAMNQLYENLEILVSDNLSTDGTEEFVSQLRLKDNRISYFRNAENLGSNGNHVIAFTKYCKSDWAVFVSDDDYLTDPEFIRRGMRAINENGGGEVAFYQSAVITHYESTGSDTIFTPNIEKDRVYEPGGYFRDYFSINFFSFTTTLFNRKYLVEEVFPKTTFGSDVQLMLIMSLEKRVLLSKEVSGVYNVHSAQNFGRSNFKNYLRLYKETYLEVCKYALSYSSLSKESIVGWRQRSLEYFKLNVEGWVKNRMNDTVSSFIIDTNNSLLIRFYPRINRYFGLSFVMFPIYKGSTIQRMKIYLPGFYYQIYWHFFAQKHR